MHAADNDTKTCDILPSNWTVADLHESVREDFHLNEACILFPHFGDETAHKSLNKPGHHTRFADLHGDGVYVETPFDQLSRARSQKPTERSETGGHVDGRSSLPAMVVPTR